MLQYAIVYHSMLKLKYLKMPRRITFSRLDPSTIQWAMQHPTATTTWNGQRDAVGSKFYKQQDEKDTTAIYG